LRDASSLIVALYAAALGDSLLVAAPLFLLIADLPTGASVAAVMNFGLVAAIWSGSTFVTALNDYWTITVAFAVGIVPALSMSVWFGAYWGLEGLIWGFNIGIGAIGFMLMGRILAEYPSDI
jgi:uncharacterized membrane protein